MTALALTYLAVGALCVVQVHKEITKRREWFWTDNLMTVLVVMFWPVMILVGLVAMKGRSGA